MEKPLSSWSVIKIYLASILLAPLGLYWFLKFFKSPDRKRKVVAYMALILTIATLIAAYFITKTYLENIYSYVQIYNKSLNF